MWWFLLACGSVENEIVTSPEPDVERAREAGRVWLVAWPPTATSLDRAASAALVGSPGSRTGPFLQAVDLDADGVDELVVGSPEEDPEASGGRARVLRGVGGWVGAVALPGPGAVLEVPAGDALNAMRVVDDQTGDGAPDLVLAVRSDDEGRVHLLDGAGAVEGARLGPADALASVASPDGDLGRTLAEVGDLDADGRDDLLFNHDAPDDGRQLVVWRSEAWVTGEAVSVSDPPAIQLGPSIRNVEVWQAPVGDLGGDGVPELVIPQAQLGIGELAEVGAVAVIDGATAGADGFRGDVAGASSRIEGSFAGQRFGTQATGLGDLDGDGASELAVVAEDVDDPEAWVVHVYSGAALATPGVRGEDDALFSLPGFHAVFPAPDLDGDAVPELVVLGDALVVVLAGGALPETTPLAMLATDAVAPTFWTTRVVVLRTESGFVLAVGMPDDDLSAPSPEG